MVDQYAHKFGRKFEKSDKYRSIEMTSKLMVIGKAFRLPGEIVSYETIKNGNINTTDRVNYTNPDKSYVFQKSNTDVFKNPVEIMKSIDAVTSHIREKSPERTTLHFHHTKP